MSNACTRIAQTTADGRICTDRPTTDFGVVAGTILPYAGRVAPPGYVMCDGKNGTPDMRSSCPVGFKSGDSPFNILNTSVGEDFVRITGTHLPPHTHDIRWGHPFGGESPVTKSDKGGFDLKFKTLWNNSKTLKRGGRKRPGSTKRTYDVNQESPVPVTVPSRTEVSGTNDGHENRQPFTYVQFIMKT